MRFQLTPLQLNAGDNHAFVDLPTLLHWARMRAAALGLWRLRRQKTRFARFLLAYIVILTALYAVYGALQGPRRHRVQLDFAWTTPHLAGLAVAGWPVVPIAAGSPVGAALPASGHAGRSA